jgi:hypothetical protein
MATTMMNSNTCASCNATASLASQTCGGCHSVKYCNKACQLSHWREHKTFCRENEPKTFCLLTIGQGDRIPSQPVLCLCSYETNLISTRKMKQLFDGKKVYRVVYKGISLQVVFSKNNCKLDNEGAGVLFQILRAGDCHVAFDLSEVTEEKARQAIATMKRTLAKWWARTMSDVNGTDQRSSYTWFLRDGAAHIGPTGKEPSECPPYLWTEFLEGFWESVQEGKTLARAKQTFEECMAGMFLAELNHVSPQLKMIVQDELDKFIVDNGIGI